MAAQKDNDVPRRPGRPRGKKPGTASREQLMDLVWGSDFYGTDRVVDVYVGQVRRKIEAATGQTLIRTIRGIGYKLAEEPGP